MSVKAGVKAHIKKISGQRALSGPLDKAEAV